MESLQLPLPQIPDEIILHQILSRLPVNSLLRFKCVSKHWRDWISDPQFKILTQRRRIAVIDTGVSNSGYIQSINEEANYSIESISIPLDKKKVPHLSNHPPMFRCLGSCNGFLLVSLGKHIFLWNPSIRVCEKVLTYKHLHYSSQLVMSGLCYDSSTNDYKVVIGSFNTPTSVGIPAIFTSLRRKCWKRVNYPYMTPNDNWGPVMNGNHHWLTCLWRGTNDGYAGVVVYIDAVNDKFSELPCPEPMRRDTPRILGLGELDGCLTLARWDNEFGVIELWVMKTYGNQESWTTLFKCHNFLGLDYPISSYFHKVEPLCITKDGEVLMTVNRSELMTYSPNKELHRTFLKHIRIHNDFIGIRAAAYAESLISPHDVIGTKIRHRGKGRGYNRKHPGKRRDAMGEKI